MERSVTYNKDGSDASAATSFCSAPGSSCDTLQAIYAQVSGTEVRAGALTAAGRDIRAGHPPNAGFAGAGCACGPGTVLDRLGGQHMQALRGRGGRERCVLRRGGLPRTPQAFS